MLLMTDLFLGVWHTSDEPSQGPPHQARCPPLPHIRRRVCYRILQETGRRSDHGNRKQLQMRVRLFAHMK